MLVALYLHSTSHSLRRREPLTDISTNLTLLENKINIPPSNGGYFIFEHSLILLATHKCVENWPASHAIITLCHKWLCRLHRWRDLSASLTEGAFLLYSFCLVSFFGGVNSFHRYRENPNPHSSGRGPHRGPPLHKARRKGASLMEA